MGSDKIPLSSLDCIQIYVKQQEIIKNKKLADPTIYSGFENMIIDCLAMSAVSLDDPGKFFSVKKYKDEKNRVRSTKTIKKYAYELTNPYKYHPTVVNQGNYGKAWARKVYDEKL